MSDPTVVPPVVTPEPTPVVIVAPPKFVRAKTLVKSTFTKVGVPVLIGAAAAWTVSRRVNAENSIEDDSLPEE